MTTLVPAGRTPDDDRPHDLGRRPGILENYQWYGHDPIANVSFISHYGTLPEAPRMWHVVLYVRLPDGTELATKQVGLPARIDVAGTPNHVLRCVEPFRTWELSFHAGMKVLRNGEMEQGLVTDGQSRPLRIDLTFEAAGPVWDPSAGSGPAEGWSDLHHEQSMRMTGHVSIDDDAIDLQHGLAYRDHSVGPRDLRNIGRHSWNNGSFPSGRSFGSLHVGHLDGSSSDRGFVVEQGELRHVDVLHVPGMRGVDGEPSSFSVELQADGRRIVVDGELLADSRSNFAVAGPAEFALGTPLDEPDSYFLAQRLVRWDWDGEVGYGMSDRGGLIRLHQPH